MRQNIEHDLMNEITTSPQVLLVTDLGEGNIGAISAAEVSAERKQQLIEDGAKPEYHKRATCAFICVDGRPFAPGTVIREHAEDEANPQGAGGEPFFATAIEYMHPGKARPTSVAVAENTKKTIQMGRTPVVHGDEHTGEEGCGANKRMRSILANNAKNIDVLAAPRVGCS
jgi:hypothetical protein